MFIHKLTWKEENSDWDIANLQKMRLLSLSRVKAYLYFCTGQNKVTKLKSQDHTCIFYVNLHFLHPSLLLNFSPFRITSVFLNNGQLLNAFIYFYFLGSKRINNLFHQCSLNIYFVSSSKVAIRHTTIKVDPEGVHSQMQRGDLEISSNKRPL